MSVHEQFDCAVAAAHAAAVIAFRNLAAEEDVDPTAWYAAGALLDADHSVVIVALAHEVIKSNLSGESLFRVSAYLKLHSLQPASWSLQPVGLRVAYQVFVSALCGAHDALKLYAPSIPVQPISLQMPSHFFTSSFETVSGVFDRDPDLVDGEVERLEAWFEARSS